jgi:hypothetical protein
LRRLPVVGEFVMTEPDRIVPQVLPRFDGVEGVAVEPMTCTRDRREHAVPDTEFELERLTKSGIYRALCGYLVLPGSLLSPPGRACRACLAILDALPTQRGRDEPAWPGGRMRAAVQRALGRHTCEDRPRSSSSPGQDQPPAGGRRWFGPAASRSPDRPDLGRLAS